MQIKLKDKKIIHPEATLRDYFKTEFKAKQKLLVQFLIMCRDLRFRIWPRLIIISCVMQKLKTKAFN